MAVTGVSGLGFTRGPYADVIATVTVAGVVLVGVAWILLGIDVATGRGGATRPRALETG
jgi:hypothetical protein